MGTPSDPRPVDNCRIPLDLHYDIANHVWVRPEGGELYTAGITDVGQTLAGELLYCEPKPPGTEVAVGKALALIESGKSIWPVRCPVAGTIVEANNQAAERPTAINADPYGEGWIVRLRAPGLAERLGTLTTGDAALEQYRLFMEDIGFGDCVPYPPKF